MKQILPIDDKFQVFKIDSTRFSCDIVKRKYINLETKLKSIDQEQDAYENVLFIISDAWDIIDSSFRAIRTLLQIRGISHKNVEIKKAERFLKVVEQFRNYFQHINSEIDKQNECTNPVFGAISWAPEKSNCSYSLSLGLLPSNTIMNSHSYDTKNSKYVDGIQLHILDTHVNLLEVKNVIADCYSLLENWLFSNKMLSTKETGKNLFKVEGIESIKGTKRFVRVQMRIGNNND